MLWECKTMNDKNWRERSRKASRSEAGLCRQMAIYQAYMEPSIPGISATRRCSPRSTRTRRRLWFELVPFDGGLAQRMSDRAVRVIQATEAGELLPRGFVDPNHFECKWCDWQERCQRVGGGR
jgi:hypothetical protein